MKRFRPNKLTTAIIICLIFSIFMACGDMPAAKITPAVHAAIANSTAVMGPVEFTHYTVDEATLLTICDSSKGCAAWGQAEDGTRFAYIFMLAEDEYGIASDKYDYVDDAGIFEFLSILGHEAFHGFTGYWHE